jgi:hypothetical protein
MDLQCFGSGSICFWAPGFGSLHQKHQKSRKNLDFYCTWLIFYFFSLKTGVNVGYLLSNEQKTEKKNLFFVVILLAGSGSDPDP